MSVDRVNAPETYLSSVREQYEELPYPPRDPKDEYRRMMLVEYDNPGMLNHYCYGGKKQFDSSFRALVAGAGTGDSTIYLAEALKEVGGQVTHLDLSEASIAIAKERATLRGLTNIEFSHASILDLPRSGLGEFDYINCTGVLHHLKEPDEGLLALKSVLKDDGVIGIMIYSYYGRHGLYMIQKALKLLNREKSTQGKLDNAKHLLEALTEEHPFKTSDQRFNDHVTMGDSGIFDLFLHSQDRAYTVDEAYDFVERAGLHLNHLFKRLDRGPIFYTPDVFIKDPYILQQLANFSPREREVFAELIHGKTAKHVFYATKNPVTALLPNNPDLVPFYSEKAIFEKDKGFDDFLKAAAGNDPQISITLATVHMSITNNPLTKLVLGAVDGKRTIDEIVRMAASQAQRIGLMEYTPQHAVGELHRLMKMLAPLNWILLRHKSVTLPTNPIMHQALFQKEHA